MNLFIHEPVATTQVPGLHTCIRCYAELIFRLGAGKYYGFSGCHRFEAFQRLEKETIPCRVRKATEKTLRQHLM